MRPYKCERFMTNLKSDVWFRLELFKRLWYKQTKETRENDAKEDKYKNRNGCEKGLRNETRDKRENPSILAGMCTIFTINAMCEMDI